MRTLVILILLSIAGTCFAEDPLETLNTVEDTLSTMEQTLNSQAAEHGDSKAAKSLPGVGAAREGLPSEEELYFVSDEPLGARGWVMVTPCVGEGANVLAPKEPDSCVSTNDEAGALGMHFWKSRAVQPAELRAGMVVVAQDKAKDGVWFLAKITDVTGIGSGHVAVSAPFTAQLKSMRVVEE